MHWIDNNNAGAHRLLFLSVTLSVYTTVIAIKEVWQQISRTQIARRGRNLAH